MAKFSTNSKIYRLSKGSICSASVDLIQNTEHVITSHIALSPNIILSITAVAGNVLILLALWRTSSLHSPSKLLLRCLATTDISVGLISQPLFVIHVVSVINKRWKICFISERSAYITSAALCGVSVLTLTAISEDSLQRTCNSSTDVDCYNHNMDCKLCECLLVPMEPVYLLNWLLYCDSSGSLHYYSLLLKNIL